jgi:hypothetical protein
MGKTSGVLQGKLLSYCNFENNSFVNLIELAKPYKGNTFGVVVVYNITSAISSHTVTAKTFEDAYQKFLQEVSKSKHKIKKADLLIKKISNHGN